MTHIQEFAEFHTENPEVWRLFQDFTKQVVCSGHRKYAVASIVERIRWHTTVDTSGVDFKINNNFRAYYARLFRLKHPELDLFRNRVSAADDPEEEEILKGLLR